MNGRHLDDALRALPRREGRSDWSDLEARISALRPARPPRRRLLRRRSVLAGLGAVLVVAGIFAAWPRADVAETAWQDAHRDAAASDPWSDPWIVAAVETSR